MCSLESKLNAWVRRSQDNCGIMEPLKAPIPTQTIASLVSGWNGTVLPQPLKLQRTVSPHHLTTALDELLATHAMLVPAYIMYHYVRACTRLEGWTGWFIVRSDPSDDSIGGMFLVCVDVTDIDVTTTSSPLKHHIFTRGVPTTTTTTATLTTTTTTATPTTTMTTTMSPTREDIERAKGFMHAKGKLWCVLAANTTSHYLLVRNNRSDNSLWRLLKLSASDSVEPIVSVSV